MQSEATSLLANAVDAIKPRTAEQRKAVRSMLKAVDKTGITLTVTEGLEKFEDQVEILERLTVAEAYISLDMAMIASIDKMSDIVQSGSYEVADQISAVKALGTIGAYFNKRKEMGKSASGGASVNVVIDNTIAMQTTQVDRPLEDPYGDQD